ncbi:MAG: DUF3520 domain-containing protein [Balneola sp.]|nr:MAG: DUF3520 domain-containing protein [Balneola sp.]
MNFVIATIFFVLFPFVEQVQETTSTEVITSSVFGKVIDVESKNSIVGANVYIKKLNVGTSTDRNGEFELIASAGTHTLEVQFIGYETHSRQISIGDTDVTNLVIELEHATIEGQEVVVSAYSQTPRRALTGSIISLDEEKAGNPGRGYYPAYGNTEEYDQISENLFNWTQRTPLSTFSIDVDGASYSNVRRLLTDGYLPPAGAVRVEEMINYFNYDYPEPKKNTPFSVSTEVAPAPWNPKHHLVQIGIQGRKTQTKDLPPNNLVFLLDVSGSMSSHNKLPLLKKAFKLLVNELREEDYVSIVVYAGSSGMVLPPTSGYEKAKILRALERLESGGATAGAAGIKLAYDVAKQNFRKNANNRVILATDGDFNVGTSRDNDLIELIEDKRDDGIFLSVLGFGTGNLKDSKMEKIANHGNGNYYYIDNLLEAKKVLVSEMGGMLLTIAKDVKIQVEFNPQNVQAYRLIGYENRLLADEDFNNDKKDAGELGSGHTVTALYEIVPMGVELDKNLTEVDPLKYQTPSRPSIDFSEELMTVKLRYKHPSGSTSMLISNTVEKNQIKEELSENLSFAASVATFGMILSHSKFKGNASFEMVNQLARDGRGNDDQGYRSEFIKLAQLADLLWQGNSSKD